jgi:hypothetical protein
MRAFALLTVAILGLPAADAAAGCRNLYYYPKVAIVQQQVQAVYYDVGADLRIKATVAKAVQEATPLIAAEAVKQFQAIQAGGGLSLKAAPQLLAQKCGRCHNPQNPETDLYFDGSPITWQHYKRFDEIFGARKNIPQKMESVVASIKPEDIGNMKQEMLSLEIAGTTQQQTAPPANETPAPPAPEAPAAPPLTNGDRRWDAQSKAWVEYYDGQWHALPAPALPAPPANGEPPLPPAPEPGGLE